MIYAVLFIHWVADFILQTDRQAKGKSSSVIRLLEHILTYTIVMVFFFGFKFGLVNGAAHFIIDFFTSKATKYLYNKGDTHNFFVVIGLDQLLHTIILIYTLEMIHV